MLEHSWQGRTWLSYQDLEETNLLLFVMVVKAEFHRMFHGDIREVAIPSLLQAFGVPQKPLVRKSTGT